MRHIYQGNNILNHILLPYACFQKNMTAYYQAYHFLLLSYSLFSPYMTQAKLTL